VSEVDDGDEEEEEAEAKAKEEREKVLDKTHMSSHVRWWRIWAIYLSLAFSQKTALSRARGQEDKRTTLPFFFYRIDKRRQC
jgi:hypothetical protein